MRESQVEKAVCEWAKANGILAIKFTPMGEVGWPDRIFLCRGKCVFIEFKAPGKAARALQKFRIGTLADAGFIAEIHDNVDSTIKTLHSALLPRNRD